MLAPESNGEVAVKAWAALSKTTGRELEHLARPKEDEKIRFPRHCRAAKEDHLVTDLVRPGERRRLPQCRLHQRPRVDPMAYADWPSATVSGSSVDASLRRRTHVLSSSGRSQVDHEGDQPGCQGRVAARRPELHNAAPEMGHPLHVFRQPADADAEIGEGP